MTCRSPLIEVQQAHLRASLSERAGKWHLAVQSYLYCLDYAEHVHDERAMRFFSAKLSAAYRTMEMPEKADFYALIAC